MDGDIGWSEREAVWLIPRHAREAAENYLHYVHTLGMHVLLRFEKKVFRNKSKFLRNFCMSAYETLEKSRT